jgi:hypothetical protein
MAVSRFDTTQVINAGAGAVDVTLPGSPVTGDLIVVFLVSAEAFPTAGINTASYSSIHNTTSASPGYQSRYKVMGGTPDTVVNVNARTTDKMVVLVRNYRGIDTSTIPDNGATTSANSTSGMPDAPSYTTVTNGALVIAFGGLDDDDVSSSVTAPSGYGNLLKADTGQGLTTAGSTAMIADKIVTTAGADDPAVFGGTGTDAWRAATWAIRPSTVTAYTLAADSASYAYTATAAVVLHGSVVGAASASFAYTATAATLYRGIPLVAASASYAYTPTDAGVLVGRVVDAQASSFAYTATAASLFRGIPLVADSASYAYTATAAGVLHGSSLDAGSASYTFTPTAAGFLRTYVLGAGSVSFAYTASDATLTYASVGAYSLSADSASYGYTATAAGLLHGSVLAADAADYAYTGTAAGLLTGRVLGADATSFAFTPSDATLTYVQPGVYTLTAESAAYAYTATDAGLEYVGTPVVIEPSPPGGSGGGGSPTRRGAGYQRKGPPSWRRKKDDDEITVVVYPPGGESPPPGGKATFEIPAAELQPALPTISEILDEAIRAMPKGKLTLRPNDDDEAMEIMQLLALLED